MDKSLYEPQHEPATVTLKGHNYYNGVHGHIMEYWRKFRERVAARNQTTKLDDDLETLEEYTQRWRSVRVIYFTMFLMALGFSIILTGIWPFLSEVLIPSIYACV